MSMILETRNLSKSFSGQTAVNNISLNIKENSVHGLMGPNGAGKSTTFKMITGILKPIYGHSACSKIKKKGRIEIDSF